MPLRIVKKPHLRLDNCVAGFFKILTYIRMLRFFISLGLVFKPDLRFSMVTT
jgi:hypothetical protein